MKIITFIFLMLVAETQLKAEEEFSSAQPIFSAVTCDVRGKHKKVRIEEECRNLGGVLIVDSYASSLQ